MNTINKFWSNQSPLARAIRVGIITFALLMLTFINGVAASPTLDIDKAALNSALLAAAGAGISASLNILIPLLSNKLSKDTTEEE